LSRGAMGREGPGGRPPRPRDDKHSASEKYAHHRSVESAVFESAAGSIK
jgi:hypothetical protein